MEHPASAKTTTGKQSQIAQKFPFYIWQDVECYLDIGAVLIPKDADADAGAGGGHSSGRCIGANNLLPFGGFQFHFLPGLELRNSDQLDGSLLL